MSQDANHATDPCDESGVADVRRVREKIAAQYNGDVRRHVADTEQMVQPLIERLGLKPGVPARRSDDDRRSGTAG